MTFSRGDSGRVLFLAVPLSPTSCIENPSASSGEGKDGSPLKNGEDDRRKMFLWNGQVLAHFTRQCLKEDILVFPMSSTNALQEHPDDSTPVSEVEEEQISNKKGEVKASPFLYQNHERANFFVIKG